VAGKEGLSVFWGRDCNKLYIYCRLILVEFCITWSFLLCFFGGKINTSLPKFCIAIA
jgi:hypothetical protein